MITTCQIVYDAKIWFYRICIYLVQSEILPTTEKYTQMPDKSATIENRTLGWLSILIL